MTSANPKASNYDTVANAASMSALKVILNGLEQETAAPGFLQAQL